MRQSETERERERDRERETRKKRETLCVWEIRKKERKKFLSLIKSPPERGRDRVRHR